MRRIGRYEIDKELGRGSMGVVYLARDPRVLRQVALKTYHIPLGMSQDEQYDFKERFLREAQAAGALSHPAIVTVYDADEDRDGVPYIAMEYVAGRSLKEVLASEARLEPGRVFEMAGTLADALKTAHGAGVVHRDIKPANIMVADRDGAIKLTDFGVARIASSELTRSGGTPGSPSYMSPEQISSKVVDGRSDLFSLAEVIYQALSGKKPFDGADLTALAYAVVHETPVPITRLVPGLPVGFEEFMNRAMAKDPEHRFADGAAFGRALEAVRAGTYVEESCGPPVLLEATVVEPARAFAAESAGLVSGSSPEPPRPGFIRRWKAIAALLLAMGGVIGWMGWHQARLATVIVDGRNTFEDADLTLVVDGREVYTRTLVAERRSARMFGKKLFNYGKEAFETSFDLPPGRYELVAQVIADQDDGEFEDRLTVKLAPGETMRLKLISKPTTGVTLEPD